MREERDRDLANVRKQNEEREKQVQTENVRMDSCKLLEKFNLWL